MMESFWSRMQVDLPGPARLADPGRARERDLRVPQDLPQPPAPSLSIGHAYAGRVRDSASDRDGVLISSISTPRNSGQATLGFHAFSSAAPDMPSAFISSNFPCISSRVSAAGFFQRAGLVLCETDDVLVFDDDLARVVVGGVLPDDRPQPIVGVEDLLHEQQQAGAVRCR